MRERCRWTSGVSCRYGEARLRGKGGSVVIVIDEEFPGAGDGLYKVLVFTVCKVIGAAVLGVGGGDEFV